MSLQLMNFLRTVSFGLIFISTLMFFSKLSGNAEPSEWIIYFIATMFFLAGVACFLPLWIEERPKRAINRILNRIRRKTNSNLEGSILTRPDKEGLSAMVEIIPNPYYMVHGHSYDIHFELAGGDRVSLGTRPCTHENLNEIITEINFYFDFVKKREIVQKL